MRYRFLAVAHNARFQTRFAFFVHASVPSWPVGGILEPRSIPKVQLTHPEPEAYGQVYEFVAPNWGGPPEASHEQLGRVTSKGDQVIVEGGGAGIRGAYHLVKELPHGFWQLRKISGNKIHGQRPTWYFFRAGPHFRWN